MSFKKILLIIVSLFAGLVVLFIGSLLLGRLLFKGEEPGFSTSQGVGLVEVKGMIVDSHEPIRQLRYFLKKTTSRRSYCGLTPLVAWWGLPRRSIRRSSGWLPKRRWWFPWAVWQPPVVIILLHRLR